MAVDSDGGTYYGEMKPDRKGKVSFTAPDEKGISHLWLVVTGAPTEHWRNIDGEDNPGDAQWPYSIKITQTK